LIYFFFPFYVFFFLEKNLARSFFPFCIYFSGEIAILMTLDSGPDSQRQQTHNSWETGEFALLSNVFFLFSLSFLSFEPKRASQPRIVSPFP